MRRRPPSRRPQSPVSLAAIEAHGLALARELARIARGSDPPAIKLEGILDILFGAFSEGDETFRGLLLDGWLRAHHEKPYRLAMGWLREQMRLSIEEIAREGVGSGAFRRDVDAAALAALCLGAAEACLLAPKAQTGAVPPDLIARQLLRFAVSGA